MIIDSPTPTGLHPSHPSTMLEKTTVVDPPAYSLIGNDEHLEEKLSGSRYLQGNASGSRHFQPNVSSTSRRGGARRGRVPPIPERTAARHIDIQHKSMPLPSPTVDQVHIHDRKHNIVGTFHIDPETPMLDPSKRQRAKSSEPNPHASFRTNHNAIDLHLGTTGDARKIAKANVHVGSRDGFVKVTLLPFGPMRPRIGLHTSSRHGTIVLFIPQNYVGIIQLYSVKGKINILPVLARHMKTVKSGEHDTMIMVGNADESCSDNVNEVSYCELASRGGDVIVGVDGLDHYVAPVGFWKKIFSKGNPEQS